MLYHISAMDRAGMLMGKLALLPTASSWVAPCIAAIVGKWAAELGPTKVGIMTVLVGMTLNQGREAVEMSLDSLINGAKNPEDGAFCGLGMSLRSARTHIEELCSQDFINVFHVITGGKLREGSAKIIEINFKKVLDPRQLEPVGVVIPVDNGTEINGNVGKICLRRSYYIYRYFVPSCNLHRLGKPNQLSAGFAAPTTADNSNQGSRTMLPTPKRLKAQTVRSDSIAEVVATKQKESEERREARATAATEGVLTMANVQALIDTAMKTYHPSLPRMYVTKEAFGMLRKRLKTANIPDLRGFITFSIRDWTQMASQSRAAYLKNPSRGDKGSPIPPAPTFTTFAYRLPYFIAAYANSIVQGVKKADKSAEQKIIAEQAAKIAKLESDKAFLIRRTRPTIPPRSVAPPVNDRLLSDDWAPPQWEERTPTLRRAGHVK